MMLVDPATVVVVVTLFAVTVSNAVEVAQAPLLAASKQRQ